MKGSKTLQNQGLSVFCNILTAFHPCHSFSWSFMRNFSLLQLICLCPEQKKYFKIILLSLHEGFWLGNEVKVCLPAELKALVKIFSL